MPFIRPRRLPRGTTLIETIVAVGLLATVILTAAGLLAMGNRQVASAGHLTRASILAESTLAQLTAGSRRLLLDRLGCDPVAAGCLVDAPSSSELPRSAIELSLTALAGPSLGDALALRISVRVTWTEGLRERRLQFTTLRS